MLESITALNLALPLIVRISLLCFPFSVFSQQYSHKYRSISNSFILHFVDANLGIIIESIECLGDIFQCNIVEISSWRITRYSIESAFAFRMTISRIRFYSFGFMSPMV